MVLNCTYRTYRTDENERELAVVERLVGADLSEPYSVYVYRYFIYSWPDLCYLAFYDNEPVGVIISSLKPHRECRSRGYIAMLAVQKNYRGHGIAKQLITRAVDALKLKGADEIVLETEVTNTIAMRLYENMGFLRSKRLNRYYLNGNDAFRLILPITEQSTILSQFLMLQQQQQLQQLQDVQSQEQLVPSFESHHII